MSDTEPQVDVPPQEEEVASTEDVAIEVKDDKADSPHSASDSKLFNKLAVDNRVSFRSLSVFDMAEERNGLVQKKFDSLNTSDAGLSEAEFAQLMDYVRELNAAEKKAAEELGVDVKQYAESHNFFACIDIEQNNHVTIGDVFKFFKRANLDVSPYRTRKLISFTVAEGVGEPTLDENLQITNDGAPMEFPTFLKWHMRVLEYNKEELKIVEAAEQKYGIPKDQVSVYYATFRSFDLDGNGRVTFEEIINKFEKEGSQVSTHRIDKIREYVTEEDKDLSGDLDWDEFIQVMRRIDSLNTQERVAAVSSQQTADTMKVALPMYIGCFIFFNVPFMVTNFVFAEEDTGDLCPDALPNYLLGTGILICIQFLTGFLGLKLNVAMALDQSNRIKALMFNYCNQFLTIGYHIWGIVLLGEASKACAKTSPYDMALANVIVFAALPLCNLGNRKEQ